jgi:Protein of unknown function (DUF3995)
VSTGTGPTLELARPRSSTVRHLTAAALAATAGLHLAWGAGSSVPFSTRDELADAVIGSRQVPGPVACYGVAGALGAAVALVEGKPAPPPGLRRVGLLGVAGMLALRGVLGLAGRTDLISPGSASPRFRRLDRRVYAPLCLALSAGAVTTFINVSGSRARHGCA